MKAKLIGLCIAVAAWLGAYGATTITVGPKLDPETRNPLTDPETGMQLGDVDALTNALTTASSYDTIELSAGIYDLSPLTNAPMANAGGGSYGATLIALGSAGQHLKGATGDPADVVLTATDSEYRILIISGNSAKLSNVTISGGNADSAHITGSWKYRRGGGVFVNGNNVTVSNCIFTGNRASEGGGAVSSVGDTPKTNSKVSNCSIFANSAKDGGGIYNIALVENCTVVSNTASGNGGGMANCTFVTNTVLSYNCAKKGGGASNCALSDCISISHNIVTSGTDGGGICGGSATNCTFRDNYASAAAGGVACLKGCDISDMYVDAAYIDSCVFHDISNIVTGVASGNVSYPNGRDATTSYFIGSSATLVRNSLFINCTWNGLTGNYNTALFCNTDPGAMSVENCTFVDNQYHYLFRSTDSVVRYLSFVNCAFAGNTHDGSVIRDVSSFHAPYMTLTNCAYGVVADRYAQAEGIEDFGCMQKTRAECGFVGEGEHPYSLKRGSVLRGRGLLLDWMEDGTDYAGNPRLRDGKVDIGCYQCWLPQMGLILFVQ